MDEGIWIDEGIDSRIKINVFSIKNLDEWQFG